MKKINTKKNKNTKKIAKRIILKKPPIITKDLPASIGMLQLTEKKILSKISAEFKKVDSKFSQIDARFSQIDARFSQIDARFNEMESRFSQIDARFSQIDARFNKLDAKFDILMAEIHRIGISVDEQNHRNKIVLDGYELLYNKINNFEAETRDKIKSLEDVHNQILAQKESTP